MAAGGMHDHVEGGFFRYSTTRQWEIPHYEKMLEDNAELLAVYAQAHRSFPSAGYDRVVRDVVRWMDATLWQDDAKAFAGSQDADEHYYTLDASERAKHGAPYVDRTVYTSWNALAASAYVAASAALDDPALEDRAHQVMRTIATRMVDASTKTLRHFDRGDGPQIDDLLTDHAALLAATLDEYETGLRTDALAGAQQIARRMRDRLEDGGQGGFFDAPEKKEPGRLARRERPLEENALAAEGLLRLAALTGEEQWHEAALRTLRSFVGEYRQWGQFAAAYASAVARALAEPLVVSVVGPDADPAAVALWRRASALTDPARHLHRLAPERDGETLARLGFPAERVAAFVCVGTVCSAPIADEASLGRQLEEAGTRHTRAD
jgi:hypothetical protein